MYVLGYDIGSSSVKASLVSLETGTSMASAFYPKQEMSILAAKPGWAEQDPKAWWLNLRLATQDVMSASGVKPDAVKAVGISYQMHGLVCTDKEYKLLRPSIIWCDSRAVSIGAQAFKELGKEVCLGRLLNSPGNFTASKLKWVKENEPGIFERIHKVMLPGDYIALRLTGDLCTTVSGLSEGMFWDFSEHKVAHFLLSHYGISEDLLPPIAHTFSIQGQIRSGAAKELGLKEGIPVAYRAGDQPNNALSLNVFEPGEIAATAGTSGVVYGVSDVVKYDPQSRVNTFAHVNHTREQNRLGVLLCINGTGILNSWLKRNSGFSGYDEMNDAARAVPIGSDGVVMIPFGNGAERMLGNTDPGAGIAGLNFNRHNRAHLARAAQEGIVFSLHYGMEIMKETGIHPSVIRAGKANMFLSDIFKNSLANLTGATIELFNTDGSHGAALGAALGTGFYKTPREAFQGLKKVEVVEPDESKSTACQVAYSKWLKVLQAQMQR